MKSTDAGAVPSLVTPVWLASRVGSPEVVVLDCSWYLPASGRDPDAEYLLAHIPGAARFDLDAVSDHASDLPHMLPGVDQFAAAVEQLGIRPDDTVVCYDGSGLNLSAARAWWMFRVFGHRRTAVLDGGFAGWIGATRPVQRGVVRRTVAGYGRFTIDRTLVCSQADVEALVAHPGERQIVDCRPAARFGGEVDEPRPGVRRGTVPGSRNIPFSEFTDPATGTMRGPADLGSLFADHGIDIARPVIALCGSGTSACVLALAVEVLRESGGRPVGPPVAIYDGSWSEWGRIGA